MYQLYFSNNVIKGFVDNKLYFTFQKPEENTDSTCFFDKQFNIVLNSAVGGKWAGVNGIDDSLFPQKYEIDYIRVYNLKN